jgi:CBS-domain-containing membrane protein
MSVAVITAPPDTPIVALARSMLQNKIGAIPIMDGGALVGIVSRADVLPFEDDQDRSLRTAADVMSRDLLAVTEVMTVPEAARRMSARGIKRAPVLREGRMIGMVSESDLLRPYLQTDGEIQDEVAEGLLSPALGTRNSRVEISVDEGVVRVQGKVHGEAQRALLLRMIRSIEGVASVDDRTKLEPGRLG